MFLTLLGITYLFWWMALSYFAVVNVGYNNLNKVLKVMVVPAGLIFLVTDFLFNAIIGSILFLQLPWLSSDGGGPAYTLSVRMRRLIDLDKGWRGKLASAIVNTLLLPFSKDY
jgi:hypothetical protein